MVFTVLTLSAAAGAPIGLVGVNDVAGFVTTARADHHGGASSGEESGGLFWVSAVEHCGALLDNADRPQSLANLSKGALPAVECWGRTEGAVEPPPADARPSGPR